MKKLIYRVVLPIFALFLVTTLHAQEKQMMSAADRAAKTTDWMKTNLGLAEDQVAKVQDINLKYANKMDDTWKSTVSKKEKKAAMMSDATAKDAELKGVLNDGQYQTYTAKKEELKKEMKEKAKESKGMK